MTRRGFLMMMPLAVALRPRPETSSTTWMEFDGQMVQLHPCEWIIPANDGCKLWDLTPEAFGLRRLA